MVKMPKRTDTIYEEIENFKDYELTQCVAYEMAIRNEKNLEDIDKIVRHYTDNKKIINRDIMECLYYASGELELLLNLIRNSHIIPFIPSIDSMQGILVNEEYFINNLLVYEDSRIDKTIYEIVDKFTISEDGDRKRNLLLDSKRVIEDDFLNLNILEKRTFRNGYFIETMISESNEHAHIPINEDENKSLSDADDWKIYLEDGGENLSTANRIMDNFKRPKLKIIGCFFQKYPNIEVDLSKPLKEIIAYISHVKNDLEKNNILKAPIELIGEELQKADNLVCDTKGKCFDTRAILSKQQKIADMFYIYDCIKQGVAQRKIQNVIYNYYADNGIETKAMDLKTLKKYKEIAIDYIDNMRYKELVTGVKL